MKFTSGTKLTRSQNLMVDERSGCLEQSESVEIYPLFRDHFNINKYSRPEEEDFLTVCHVLEEIAQAAFDCNMESIKTLDSISMSTPAPAKKPLAILSKIFSRFHHLDYTVGWICALPTELAAAVAMLDERHDSLPQNPHDDTNYSLGRIGNHNIVIACLPLGVIGVTSAASVATQLQSTFPSIRFGLMVGIGGGAPSVKYDIRLGDVVVSRPSRTSGGVVQYELGMALLEDRFVRTGSLNRQPDVLIAAVSTLQARHLMGEPEFTRYLEELTVKYPKMQRTYTYQGSQHDTLFDVQSPHVGAGDTCLKCNDQCHEILREARPNLLPVVHYGLIASAINVIQDAITRVKMQKASDAICFEMEAAGLMHDFPCLVIRGICDYADSHKNKRWQPYAAATASAYAKELLSVIPSNEGVFAGSDGHGEKLDRLSVLDNRDDRKYHKVRSHGLNENLLI